MRTQPWWYHVTLFCEEVCSILHQTLASVPFTRYWVFGDVTLMPPEKWQVHIYIYSTALIGALDQQLGAEQDLLLWLHRSLFQPLSRDGNLQGLACHTPQQPPQNHPSGHVGGWTTTWAAEEMLGGQHQRVDIPAYARTAHKGLLQKRLEEDLC